MGPNQNFGQNVTPVTPVTPAAPAAPVRPAATPTVALAPVVTKKKGSGMIIGMVLLALVAIGGVGFGVFMYMEKDNVKTELEAQVKNLKGQIIDLQEQIAKAAETTTTVTTLDISDYGVKIEVPETLLSLTYSLNSDGYYCVNGYVDKGTDVKPSFASNPSSAVCLYRVTTGQTDDKTGVAAPAFTLSGYDYYVFAPQTIATTVADEAAWEEESVKLIADTLRNVENYSE